MLGVFIKITESVFEKQFIQFDHLSFTSFISDMLLITIFILCYYLFSFIRKIYFRSKGALKEIRLNHAQLNIQPLKENFLTFIEFNKDKSKDCFHILREMRMFDIVPEINIYKSLIIMSYRLEQFDNVRKLYATISDEIFSPVQIDLDTYKILVEGISIEKQSVQCSENKVNELSQMLIIYEGDIEKRQLKLDMEIVNMFIHSWIQLGDLQKSLKFYHTMKNKKIEPNKKTYILILKGLKNCIQDHFNDKIKISQHLEMAFDILSTIKRGECHGISLDIDIYNCILDLCIKFKLIKFAENLFIEIKTNGLVPSERTYAIMIKGFGNCCKLETAFLLLSEFALTGLNSDKIYLNLMNTCFNFNKFEILIDIYHKMKYKKIAISEQVYTLVIKTCGKIKNFKKGFEVIESIPKIHYKTAHINLFTSIFELGITSGKIGKLFSMFSHFLKINEEIELSQKMTIDNYLLLAQRCILMGKFVEAKKFFNMIKEKADKLDQNAFNIVAEYFLMVNEVELCLSVINELRIFGLKKNVDTYAIILRIYTSQLNELKSITIFDEMLKSNIRPNYLVYCLLLDLFINKKKIMQAIGIFNDMKLNKIKPDSHIYNNILNFCVVNQRLDLAFQILGEGCNNNILFSLDTINIIIKDLELNKSLNCNEIGGCAEILIKIIDENNYKIDAHLANMLNRLSNQKRSSNHNLLLNY